MWCESKAELKSIMGKRNLYRGRLFIGKIRKWDRYMHWEFTQIEAKYNWIGVEGLSLNLWNMETFRKIGEACGGLIEVGPETKNQSFLLYAMLKVKGFSNGYLHPIAQIPCENEMVHVGLFSIGPCPVKGEAQLCFTRGILARSI